LTHGSEGLTCSSLPVGGIERDYVCLYPEREPGERPGGETAEEDPHQRDDILDFLHEEMVRGGGWLEALDTASCFSARFLPDGGRFSIEDFMPLLLEYAGPESGNCLEAVEAVAGFERMAAAAAEKVDPSGSSGFMLVYGPGRLPRLGREGEFRLGTHYNFAVHLPSSLLRELEACLTCLAPLLASGGLSPEGFCRSPTGLAAAGLYDETDGFSVRELSLVEQRRWPVAVTREYDRRLHVGFIDPPFTRRQMARNFLTLQLIIALLVKGCRLLPPSGRPDARYLLGRASGGGPDPLHDRLLRRLRSSLAAALEEGVLSRELRPHLEELHDSLGALLRGDEDWLAQRYDSFFLKRVFEEMCALFGVTLDYFNRVAVPLVQLACSCSFSEPRELSRMDAGEIKRLLERERKFGKRARMRLRGLMRKKDVAPEEIPALAGMVHYFQSLLLRLHSVYPPAPLRPLEEGAWEAFRAGAGLPPARPTRAEVRGRMVRELNREGMDGYCRADFANLYLFEPEAAEIYSMPSAYFDEAVGRRISREEAPAALEGLELKGQRYAAYVELNWDLIHLGSPSREGASYQDDDFPLYFWCGCEDGEPEEEEGDEGEG